MIFFIIKTQFVIDLRSEGKNDKRYILDNEFNLTSFICAGMFSVILKNLLQYFEFLGTPIFFEKWQLSLKS